MQVLPPQVTYDRTTDLTSSLGQLEPPTSGTWSHGGSGYTGTAASTGGFAPVSLEGTKRVASTSWLEVTTKVRAQSGAIAGLVFDGYATNDYKFAGLDLANQRVVIGHWDPRRGWVVDASVAKTLTAGTLYDLSITLKGTSVSVAVNGGFAVSTGFNAGVVDGRFGLMARSGTATFTSLRVRTDDPVFLGAATAPVEEPPVASVSGVRVTEGNSGQKTATVTVTLSKAAASEVRVAWSLVAGSALAGSDFAAGSGELVFAAGETSRTISVTILGDTVVEADETLSVVLGTASGATIEEGTATVTIENDDTAVAPKPTVSIKSVSTTELDTGSKTVQVPITLSAPSTEPVTVTVKLAPGTATPAPTTSRGAAR